MSIVLIHGFAVGLTAPPIREAFGPSASFDVFEDAVAEGDASVFPWGIAQELPWWKLLDVRELWDVYKKELHMAQSEHVHEALREFLDQKQPNAIVCHSMGCTLLAEYLKHFSLPASVKSVVFVQADFPADQEIPTDISIHHIYCPWDPTLLLSSIVQGRLRAGLTSTINAKKMTSHLVPLVRPWNLHTSSIRDERLFEILDEAMK